MNINFISRRRGGLQSDGGESSFTSAKSGAEEVLAMLSVGAKCFHHLNVCVCGGGGGERKMLPYICFRPNMFPFSTPPLPVINDNSLKQANSDTPSPNTGSIRAVPHRAILPPTPGRP